ncbi:MAG: right-handed parallel beta-helix repeat-containing protein [Pseudomonadota bacterium]
MFSVGKKLMLTTAAIVASGMLYSAPAYAQATRTWISGVGDDVNPCSRTAPCKTFAGAISKTANGGEINCLDPGGFGGVTVTKSMTFICDTVEGGVLVTGQNGFTINAADTDVVTISGMDIFGPTSGPGLNGVRFINGAGLNIRNTTIKGMSTQGVSFEVGAGDTSFLNIDNVTIMGSGTTGDATTGAIKIAPGTGSTANVVITNTRVQGNQNVGLRVDLTGTTTSKANVQLVDSTINNSGSGVLLKALAGTGAIALTATDSLFSGNTNIGVAANGTGVTSRFSRTTITQNGAASPSVSTGVLTSNGAATISYGTNVLAGNFNNTNAASDGVFSSTVTQN